MNVAIHPKLDQLAAFGHGKSTAVDANEIADHLAECVTCQQWVDTLPDDALLSVLRPLFTPGQQTSTGLFVESWMPSELAVHPRYRLQEWIGAGGMGVVYKAEHRLMERPVALKVISKQLTVNPVAVDRFQREVKAAAKLSHPNIVAAYDAEQAGDLHFLVMEFVEGVSLARLVEDSGPLSIEVACDHVRQVALGLHHAFESGMVHRDIKPQNLMLTPKGQVKILDFGLAGFVSANAPVGSLTEFGQGLGTPDYVAPEQIRDAHAADIRADIYSLGCTLYFLLAGHPPFPDGSAAQKIAAHLERTPRPISDLRKDVPEGLSHVVSRMMAKEPGHRLQMPNEVGAALTSFTGSGVVPRGQADSKKYWLQGVGLAVVLCALSIVPVVYRLAPGNAPHAPTSPDPERQPLQDKPLNVPSTVGGKATESAKQDKKIEGKKVFAPDIGDYLK